MSFQGLTPESLVERSDSKNPATTCKGLTSTGRICRRALASSPNQTPTPSPSRNANGHGVVAILDEGDAAAFFCWQHKDQADNLVAKVEQQRRTKILSLAKKSSIDTLIERVGVLDLDDQARRTRTYHLHQRKEPGVVKKKDVLPQEWQAIHGPLMSVPEDVVISEIQGDRPARRDKYQKDERFGRSNVKASWSCCIQADDDYEPPPRKHNHQRLRSLNDYDSKPSAGDISSSQGNVKVQKKQVTLEMQHQTSGPNKSPLISAPQKTAQLRTATQAPSYRPSSSALAHSQTSSFLSLIPPHLSPTTTSALLAELSKPISEADEAGFIYIFWLTPESEASKPDDETASSLLDDDSAYQADLIPQLPSGSRRRSSKPLGQTSRTNQALQRYASIKHGPTISRKILLKIGRASNVHRRLSQWTKQCGQNISLVRYYPYHRDHAATSTSPAGIMVPHVHKVERLIHLELANQKAVSKGPCEQCGREHREWFEVDANKEAIRRVDEVVRRWVGWAERQR